MSPAFVVPENLLARFQALSFERLERIDSGWMALTQGTAPPTLERDVLRDVHTLKGDARVVGFREVALLSQRLEDLLVAAKARRFRVHDDVDIVVTMAIQFIGMLLRKRGDAPRMGIDLDGFVHQIDEVLAEWVRRSSEAPKEHEVSAPHLRVAEAVGRIGTATRQRIATAATLIYLEHLRSEGDARDRLARVWDMLSTEVTEFESVSLAPLLERHARAAELLATDLGKVVDVTVEAAEVRARADVVDTLNTATLHAIRNAIDHGLETPEVRRAAGKPETGSLVVGASTIDEMLEIRIADDGKGVDLDGVREAARSRGLLAEIDSATPEMLLDLLFSPGFTTRADVTTVSGRGIGLDAARSALEAMGGRASMTSEAGKGTVVTFTVPQPALSIDVHAFTSPATGATIAISREWSPTSVTDAQPVDVEALLDLRREPVASAAHTLLLSRDGVVVAIGSATPPRAERAVRICPTPRDAAVEVVRIGADEALLVRLEILRGKA